MEGVISVNPNYEDGEIVKGLGTQRQMAANIFIYANDRDELAERVSRVIENFRVFDENDENMLLKPFDTDIIIQEY